jgi:hypothetical protein
MGDIPFRGSSAWTFPGDSGGSRLACASDAECSATDYLGQSISSVAWPSGIVIRSSDAHLRRRPRYFSSSLTMLRGLHAAGQHG